MSGSFQVNDLNVDPFYIVDPTATLVVHGPVVSVANLQPISSEADIGTETTPFYRVYADYVDCKNVTTESTNLNAVAVATSNNTTLIAGLGTVYTEHKRVTRKYSLRRTSKRQRVREN